MDGGVDAVDVHQMTLNLPPGLIRPPTTLGFALSVCPDSPPELGVDIHSRSSQRFARFVLQREKHVSFLFVPLYFIFRRRCISALDLCNGVKERFKGEICAGSSKRLCVSHPQRSAAL